MASPVKRRATYEDLLKVADHQVAEIIGGDMHVSPRPASRHALASAGLGGQLWGAYQQGRGGPGGWWILDEPELHLGEDVLVPDLAGWRRARMPDLPDAAHSELAPDWVCEVLSPGTRAIDLTDKRRIYAGVGVPHLWLVDPTARTLEAFDLRDGAWTLIAALKEAEDVRVPPFDAIAFPLSVLWPD